MIRPIIQKTTKWETKFHVASHIVVWQETNKTCQVAVVLSTKVVFKVSHPSAPPVSSKIYAKSTSTVRQTQVRKIAMWIIDVVVGVFSRIFYCSKHVIMLQLEWRYNFSEGCGGTFLHVFFCCDKHAMMLRRRFHLYWVAAINIVCCDIVYWMF